jgi:hypothetical protein
MLYVLKTGNYYFRFFTMNYLCCPDELRSVLSLMSVRDCCNSIKIPPAFSMADRLSYSQPQKIYLKNLQGSSSQFVVAATFLHPSCSQLNILS